jgi:hypothetical protein
MIKSASPEPDRDSGSPVAFQIEEVSDPAEIARCRAQHERAQRNTEWLEAHWAELLPQARGKFLAVAEQEAFLADTAVAAWTWVEARHSEDDGAIVRYVRPEPGPRIYESFGQVVLVR